MRRLLDRWWTPGPASGTWHSPLSETRPTYDAEREQAGRSQERYRRARLATVASLLARGAGIGSLIVSASVVSRGTTDDEFGLWILLATAISVIGFADLGIGNGLLNVISEAYGRSDAELARRAVSSATTVLGAVALGFGAIYLVVGTRVGWAGLLGVDTVDEGRVTASVSVLVICVLLSLPLGLAQRVSLGYQEGWIANLWIFAGNVASTVVVVVGVALDVDVVWLVAASLSALPLAYLGTAIQVFGSRHPELRPRLGGVDRAVARRVLAEGFQFFVLGTAFVVGYQSDSAIVAQHLGVEAAAELAVPFRLFMLAPTLVALIANPLWPAYGEALARGDTRWMRTALIRSLVSGFAITTVAGVVLVAVFRPLVDVWVGGDISPPISLLLGLAVWAVIYGVSAPIGAFLNGVGALKVQVVGSILMALTNVVGSFVLVRVIGVEGPVIATIATHSVFVLGPAALVAAGFSRSARSGASLAAWRSRWTRGIVAPSGEGSSGAAAVGSIDGC